ncbi:F0F1 ATP synthase subunit gamma, partial [Gemmiger formicilis]|nr:F0F1 ATP synthase subunit gamma [Gemmiger formicilis]
EGIPVQGQQLDHAGFHRHGGDHLGIDHIHFIDMPFAEQVLSHIVPGYLKSVLFGALVESFCSEQNARMSAMDT